MKTGKLPPALLEERVLSRQGARRPEVVVPAALGEDSSVLDLDGELCVVSTDPITGSGSEIGWLAVHVSCNDVASNGADPVGILLTILVPEHWELDQLEALVEQADRAAQEAGIQIIGGHTEVTPDIPRLIISGTVIGRAPRDRLVTSAGLKPGSYIVVTKGVGLEGTAILAYDYRDRLVKQGVPPEVIDGAARLASRISVVPEARIASQSGATAMHDVTEGGVLGALYEMARASGVGLEARVDDMPVLPETRYVCDALRVDPMLCLSSTTLLQQLWRGHYLTTRVSGCSAGATAWQWSLPRAMNCGE